MSPPVRPAITLRRLDPGDADDVAAVVAAAVAGALPADVMPPDAAPDPDEWTVARERAYARFLRAPPAGETSWLVVEGVARGGEIVGVARLAGCGAATLEAGVWLTRTARGRGVEFAALGELVACATGERRPSRRPVLRAG